MIRLIAYVWVGLVLGVSFLATPVKFQADSLTLPVALDVGRATFHALAKAEWALSVFLLVGLASASRSGAIDLVDLVIPTFILVVVAVQALWLIPQLDVRVAAIIAGQTLAKSHLHTVFAGLEFAKVLALLVVGSWTGSHT